MTQPTDQVAQRTRKRLLKTGWIDHKQWLHEEGERVGSAPFVVWSRVNRGRYAGKLLVKKLNQRVIMVKPL